MRETFNQLKRNFKENIIRKYLGERITKEVVISVRCNFLDISYLSESQKNNFKFLSKNQDLHYSEEQGDVLPCQTILHTPALVCLTINGYFCFVLMRFIFIYELRYILYGLCM